MRRPIHPNFTPTPPDPFCHITSDIPSMSLLSSFFSILNPNAAGVRRVEPAEAARLVQEKQAVLVDVREPAEWAGGVVAGAALLPLSDLHGSRAKWKPFLAQVAGREIISYCLSGSRSGTVARVLAAEGFKTANGGSIHDWIAAGQSVTRPKSGR